MTVTAFSEQGAELQTFDLRSAMTLEELLGLAADLLTPYGIDHAVLFCIPSPVHSMMLPLLPVEAELQSMLSSAVRKNAHPAACLGREVSAPKQLSDLGGGEMKDPAFEALQKAFCKAGMRQVYEMSLGNWQGTRYVLEAARIGGSISDAELSELQAIAWAIPGKLPSYLTVAPLDGGRVPDYVVR